MAAPSVGWYPATLSARNALTVTQLEIGLFAAVLENGGLYQAVAAGTGAACWSGAAGRSDLSVVDPQLPRLTQVKALVAAGAFVTVPAPATGFIRTVVLSAASLGATPNINCTLENSVGPTSLYLAGRATTLGAATAVEVAFPSGGAVLAFGATEIVKVANGGTADAELLYIYSDISATNRTLVRAQYGNVGNAAVEVIPAAPVGYFSRIVWVTRQYGFQASITPAGYFFNDDTAAVVSDLLIGSTVVQRKASMAAAANAGFSSSGPAITVTTEALSVKAQAAATDATRRPIVFACYETLPL